MKKLLVFAIFLLSASSAFAVIDEYVITKENIDSYVNQPPKKWGDGHLISVINKSGKKLLVRIDLLEMNGDGLELLYFCNHSPAKAANMCQPGFCNLNFGGEVFWDGETDDAGTFTVTLA